MNPNNVFITEKCINEDCTYKWSIVSKFGECLREAEKVYGNRDKNFTILGIELISGNDEGPRIWHPWGFENKNIIIQITAACANNVSKAIYEVAHETIHCLHPSKIEDTTNLEEGLAECFASLMLEKNKFEPKKTYSENYKYASELVHPILEEDPHIIKKLRSHTSQISSINKEDFHKIGFMDNNIIDQLLERFKY